MARSAPAPVDNVGKAPPLLAVDKVSIEYKTRDRRVRATHRASFEVHEAERSILLGASGCGKSTLLKAIAGFIEPTEGRIEIDGKPVRGPGPDRIVVFQEFDQLPPWKTLRQNVAFPLLASRKLGRREADERAMHYLDKVGLSAFADAYPHTLSGGMKQRVAIARALAMEPAVLLCDEITSALDPELVGEVLRVVESLADEGMTLLMVTHEMSFARKVSDRVIFMHQGRVHEMGPPAELFGNPQTAELKQFLSSLHD